ncbi:MAG: AmmeMemoRadiSam system protein B [Bryobacterales bacterium]|nr:AmmeMemoRadiSam system protein B [Bryobacterales bacterium]
MPQVHRPPTCGHWYPADPFALRDMLDERFTASLERSDAHLFEGALGCVVPHAGLAYSGGVAAAAFHLIRSARRVILLGFCHQHPLEGVRTPDIGAYETPLGEIEVEACDFPRMPESQLCDHSLEMQLPLLRYACPEARVIPLYVGRLTSEARAQAAARLRAYLDGSTAILASSDFTHFGDAFGFHPFAADAHAPERIRALDQEAIDAAASLDPDWFLETLRTTRATVCGYLPIQLLLATLREWPEEIYGRLLDYQTSAEITGSYDSSVSYAALAFLPASAYRLSEADGAALVSGARNAIELYQRTGLRKPPAATGSAALGRRMGVFVSLHQQGELRGCIGARLSTLPLSRLTPLMALRAALDDPRFQPLAPGEPECDIEVSVLTPMKRVHDPAGIVPGVHGVYVESKSQDGLLLRQVAAERGWDSEELLSALARKAGLPRNVYTASGTRLSVFQAQIFHRDSTGGVADSLTTSRNTSGRA